MSKWKSGQELLYDLNIKDVETVNEKEIDLEAANEWETALDLDT